MTNPAKWALGIVGGGLVLGAFLGDAANPRIKDPQPQWWQLTGRDEIVPSSDHAFFEAGPEDLSPHDGFRPDLDYDAVVWELPIPAYEMAALMTPSTPAMANDLPRVTYGVEADAAVETVAEEAYEAEEAVTEALAAEGAAAAAPEEEQPEQIAGIY